MSSNHKYYIKILKSFYTYWHSLKLGFNSPRSLSFEACLRHENEPQTQIAIFGGHPVSCMEFAPSLRSLPFVSKRQECEGGGVANESSNEATEGFQSVVIWRSGAEKLCHRSVVKLHAPQTRNRTAKFLFQHDNNFTI